MARPHNVTALLRWMVETGRNDTKLAKEISLLMPDKTVTARQVARWRKGLFVPRPYYVALLTELSGGRVTADSFVEAKMKDPPDAESGP